MLVTYGLDYFNLFDSNGSNFFRIVLINFHIDLERVVLSLFSFRFMFIGVNRVGKVYKYCFGLLVGCF